MKMEKQKAEKSYQEIFDQIKKEFPGILFIPDHSSKDKEKPDYFQIFYGSSFIGIVYNKTIYPEKMYVEEGIKRIGLPEERISKLVELIKSIDY